MDIELRFFTIDYRVGAKPNIVNKGRRRGSWLMEVLVQKFVNFLERDKRLSLNTLQSYRRDIEQYITYLREINLQNISNTNKTTVIAYLLYLQKKGRATSTISRNLASIRSFYQYIAKNKIIDQDPTSELESPKVEKKLPQILSTKEVELLLEQPKCVDLKGYRDKSVGVDKPQCVRY